MAVNKVVYNGKTLVDLTKDTASPENTLAGVTGHMASGEAFTGTIPRVAGGTITPGAEEQLAAAAGSYVSGDILVAAISGGLTVSEVTLTSYTRSLSVPWPKNSLPKYVVVAAADDVDTNSGITLELYHAIWTNLGTGKARFSGLGRKLAMAGMSGWYYYLLSPNSPASTQMPTYEISLSGGIMTLNFAYGYTGKRRYIVYGFDSD